MKKTFAENNLIGFSPHTCQAASTRKVNLINMDVDEIILNFSKFYKRQLTVNAPNEIELNSI